MAKSSSGAMGHQVLSRIPLASKDQGQSSSMGRLFISISGRSIGPLDDAFTISSTRITKLLVSEQSVKNYLNNSQNHLRSEIWM